MAIKGCGIIASNKIIKFAENMNDIVDQWLEESAGELVARTAANSRVDTGQTKGSYDYAVDKDEKQAIVGHTYGKTPNRPMVRAFNDAEDKIVKRIRSLLKDLGVGDE